MADRKQLMSGMAAAWRSGSLEKRVKVSGTSMAPLIMEGDTIVFRPLSAAGPPRVGDIVVFERSACLVVHRIVDRWSRGGRRWLKEKGDGKFLPRLIPEDIVIGTVVRIERAGSTADLNNLHWLCLNRLIGYYWKLLFSLLNVLRNAAPRRRSGGWYATLKRIACFFISLPTRLFRFR